MRRAVGTVQVRRREQHPAVVVEEVPAGGAAAAVGHAVHVGAVRVHHVLLVARVIAARALEDDLRPVAREVRLGVLPAEGELPDVGEVHLTRLRLHRAPGRLLAAAAPGDGKRPRGRRPAAAMTTIALVTMARILTIARGGHQLRCTTDRTGAGRSEGRADWPAARGDSASPRAGSRARARRPTAGRRRVRAGPRTRAAPPRDRPKNGSPAATISIWSPIEPRAPTRKIGYDTPAESAT